MEVSPSLISEVTDAVIEEVKAWQTRRLETLYPILFLDALMVKMRQGKVESRAVYVAIGIDLEGRKDVLGLWTSSHEGAKFWLQVLTELRNRGVKDIFIACVDGLKGFPEAIETVFPQTQVQLCIVHLVRASLNYVNWKERKAVARDLKAIYRAATTGEAERELAVFAARWNAKYPTIAALWRRHWEQVIPFFAYPADIRRIVYTTNAVESLNMTLRKAVKTRGAFPSEEAALKVLYLALRNVIAKWKPPLHWKAALPGSRCCGKNGFNRRWVRAVLLRPADLGYGRPEGSSIRAKEDYDGVGPGVGRFFSRNAVYTNSRTVPGNASHGNWRHDIRASMRPRP